MSTVAAMLEKTELERAELKLRQISQELRHIAPSVATRAGALAQTCELRIRELEIRHER
jgi:hypothetical protein